MHSWILKKKKDRESKSSNKMRKTQSKQGRLPLPLREYGLAAEARPNPLVATSVSLTPQQLKREVGQYRMHEERVLEMHRKDWLGFSVTEKGRVEERGKAQWQELGIHAENQSGVKAQKWKLWAVNSS